MDSLSMYTKDEYRELKILHAIANRAKEKELPKIENKLIKKLIKKIPIHQN